MPVFKNIKNQIAYWKNQFHHGSFAYADSNSNFPEVVAQHFGNASRKVYGAYLIRQRNSEVILYIGKGGTACGDGQFKGQDVPGRLRNVRGDDVGADHWFRELL